MSDENVEIARQIYEASNVWTMSNGKVASLIAYTDHAEALKAAGLSE